MEVDCCPTVLTVPRAPRRARGLTMLSSSAIMSILRGTLGSQELGAQVSPTCCAIIATRSCIVHGKEDSFLESKFVIILNIFNRIWFSNLRAGNGRCLKRVLHLEGQRTPSGTHVSQHVLGSPIAIPTMVVASTTGTGLAQGPLSPQLPPAVQSSRQRPPLSTVTLQGLRRFVRDAIPVCISSETPLSPCLCIVIQTGRVAAH